MDKRNKQLKVPLATLPFLSMLRKDDESAVDVAVRRFHDEFLACIVTETELDDEGNLILIYDTRPATGCCKKHVGFFN